MATTTATIFSSSISFLVLLLTMINPTGSSPLQQLETSSISAAPSELPTVPKHSSFPPALAPDMMPVFPSPGGVVAPVGSLPTIPSSPSPPNPDSLQPDSANAPSGPTAAATAAVMSSPAATSSLRNAGGVYRLVLCSLALVWWL